MNSIVQCIIVDDEPVARDVLENHLGRIDTVKLVASCKNAMEAFQAVNSREVDLVFLDINMPDISGLTFARSLKGDPKIIFTTAYREYAVDGFDLRAVDYLLKPISFERLLQAINKYFEERPKAGKTLKPEASAASSEFIFVKADRKMIRVTFAEILYIESYGDYIKIHLEDKRVLVSRDTLGNIEARLPSHEFIRIHRSYIAAIKKIDSYTNDTITLGKHEIPISRSYRESVGARLGGALNAKSF